jgi:hypothetical protein
MDPSSIRGDGGGVPNISDQDAGGGGTDGGGVRMDASEPEDAPDAAQDASTGNTTDQDAEVTESDDPLCESVDCGDNGACQIFEDEARCACENGYEGELCDECEEGLVRDGDSCVEPCDASNAPDCGDNGSCEAEESVAACVCEHPFAGDACDECARGFALQPDGTCEPDCGECGAHEFCNEELMTPSCECVAGYGDEGGSCRWFGDGITGGIVDGDFEDSDAWTFSNMNVGEGVAEFENLIVGDACKLGSIEQVIRMPAQADAEPLMLVIEARTTCTSADPKTCPPLLVDIDETVTRLEMPGGPSPVTRELTVCLGEAAFQEETLLRVRPGLATGNGPAACTATWPSLQQISIRPATPIQCPQTGMLLGDLSSSDGWSFRGNAAISGNKLAINSSTAEARTLISIPASGGVALRVTTPSPSNTEVLLDGLPFQSGTVTSPAQICFPEWTFGSTHGLSFEMLVSTTEITGLSVVADATCTGAFDGGFEKPLGTGSWSYYIVPASRMTYSEAHSGGYAWRAQSSPALLMGLVLFPAFGDDTRRPAMSAFTRAGGMNMEGTLNLQVGSLSGYPITTRVHTSWGSKRVACLGEEWAGQPAFAIATASAQMTSGSGTPTHWIDDVYADSVEASNCD